MALASIILCLHERILVHLVAQYQIINETVMWVVILAESGQSRGNDADYRSMAAAPSSLAFTIDFGQNSDKPEITDHWKQLTPYRVHAGVQQRSTATKSRSANKQQTDGEIGSRKTNKVCWSC